MRRCFQLMTIVAFIAMGSIISAAYAQEKAPAPVKKIAVRAGHLIDGRNDKVIDNALIVIEGDPLANVANLHRVKRVIANGHLYDMNQLINRAAPLTRSF